MACVSACSALYSANSHPSHLLHCRMQERTNDRDGSCRAHVQSTVHGQFSSRCTECEVQQCTTSTERKTWVEGGEGATVTCGFATRPSPLTLRHCSPRP